MNTRSKAHKQDEATSSEALPSHDRGNNQQEHEHEDTKTKPRDVVTEMTENLHKISFGEPRVALPKDVPRITRSSQLEEELPAICNEVFRVLGPYNLEATYQQALALELKDRGVTVFSEVRIPVEYKGQIIATRRMDLYLKLDKPVILELKAVVTGLKTDHMKQLNATVDTSVGSSSSTGSVDAGSSTTSTTDSSSDSTTTVSSSTGDSSSTAASASASASGSSDASQITMGAAAATVLAVGAYFL
ncbi:GxxExxY protein [Phytophthora cactorum]|nr:GxxExxY protein [Phytophthora cactorum]